MLTVLLCTGCIQELETFLDRHDEAQLEKRKWQHLNWTYDVWLPLQKRVKQHLSRSRYMRERQRAYRVKLLKKMFLLSLLSCFYLLSAVHFALIYIYIYIFTKTWEGLMCNHCSVSRPAQTTPRTEDITDDVV